MFVKKVNRNNDKEMFEFLKEHFTYNTMNSWNNLQSIANNVKVYNLDLEGDCWKALNKAQQDDYDEINWMIRDWERNNGYEVGFNGASGGYLVLYNRNPETRQGDNDNVLPDCITYNDNYEEYKEYLKEYGDTVAGNRSTLREYVDLVCSFDQLCEDLRDLMNAYSKCDLVGETTENIVNIFNDDYCTELEELNIGELEINNNGSNKIYIKEIKKYNSLMEAFRRVVNSWISGTSLELETDDDYAWIKEN